MGILGEISRTEGGSTGNIRRFIDMIADNTCSHRKGNMDGKGRFGLFMQTEDVRINSCMNVGPRAHAVQSSLSGRCCYIHPPYVVNLQVSMREIHRAPSLAGQYLLRIASWPGLPHVCMYLGSQVGWRDSTLSCIWGVCVRWTIADIHTQLN